MKKARSWFWFIVQLLPFIAFAFFMLARLGQGTVQFSSLSEMLSDIFNYTNKWQFTPVADGLISVFRAIGISLLHGHFVVISLVSYEIFVLFCRIFYEVIAFLPKFCISFFERKM